MYLHLLASSIYFSFSFNLKCSYTQYFIVFRMCSIYIQDDVNLISSFKFWINIKTFLTNYSTQYQQNIYFTICILLSASFKHSNLTPPSHYFLIITDYYTADGDGKTLISVLINLFGVQLGVEINTFMSKNQQVTISVYWTMAVNEQ